MDNTHTSNITGTPNTDSNDLSDLSDLSVKAAKHSLDTIKSTINTYYEISDYALSQVDNIIREQVMLPLYAKLRVAKTKEAIKEIAKEAVVTMEYILPDNEVENHPELYTFLRHLNNAIDRIEGTL